MAEPQINAVEFSELVTSSHTHDGSHGLFTFKTEQGEFTIAIPNSQMPRVMASLSDISAKNSRLLSGSQRQALAFPSNIWNFEADPKSDVVNMTFRMPGGMEMTFQLSKKQIPLMKDALTAAETGQPLVLPYGQIG